MASVTPLLQTHGLSKHFGGLHAVEDVELAVPQGEIRAVIGPNGAGKTTLVSLFSGRLQPTSGTILFNGEDITRIPAHGRVRKGIVYTFQVTSVFGNLSCYENVALAAQRQAGMSRKESAIAERVAQVLAQVGLDGVENQQASNLPYGHQRLLEVAMGLAAGPELLILDEPTQGLAEGEIARLCELVQEIAKQATVLLIEHNMSVVMGLAERITVMNSGKVLAEGTPEEIENNALVQETYLGT
ncbi:MAG: ABC transporter ATP-binding protein [SAR324 cluster bacterium]|nr:ABC transporter ATP-binding protein [SAR324 cluster bacterium]